MFTCKTFLGSVCLLGLCLGVLTVRSASAASVPEKLTVTKAGVGTGTVTSIPAGIKCPGTCVHQYTKGTSVKLTAVPASGSTFTGWSGACSGKGNPCTLDVNAALTTGSTFAASASRLPLNIEIEGGGTGTVTSSPAGIHCPQTCTASYTKGTHIVLTAIPAQGTTFAGWSGTCTGKGTCSVSLEASTTVTPSFQLGTSGLASLNHIVFFAQENRSLDEYFGAMRQYWADNGIPDQSFDGLPQFNPASGAPPLRGPAPTNPRLQPGGQVARRLRVGYLGQRGFLPHAYRVQ